MVYLNIENSQVASSCKIHLCNSLALSIHNRAEMTSKTIYCSFPPLSFPKFPLIENKFSEFLFLLNAINSQPPAPVPLPAMVLCLWLVFFTYIYPTKHRLQENNYPFCLFAFKVPSSFTLFFSKMKLLFISVKSSNVSPVPQPLCFLSGKYAKFNFIYSQYVS